MCRFKLRFSVIAFTLKIGILVIWLSAYLLSFSSQSQSVPLIINPLNGVKNKSGKVEIRFNKFTKAENEMVAEFELINDSAEPVKYAGYSKDSYCTVFFNNGKSTQKINLCWCGTGLGVQTLSPNETAKYEITESTIRRLSEMEKNKQISGKFGFKISIGANSREEILWSEPITFSTQ